MKKIAIQNPSDWEQVGAGEIIEFPAMGGRTLELRMNTDREVTVHVSGSPNMDGETLVCCERGMFEIAVTVKGTCYLSFVSDPEAEIYINSKAKSQIVAARELPVLTSVEPQGRRNSEFDRMMQYMKLNEMRRDRELAQERAALRAEREALAEAQAQAAAEASAAAAAAAGEGGEAGGE